MWHAKIRRNKTTAWSHTSSTLEMLSAFDFARMTKSSTAVVCVWFYRFHIGTPRSRAMRLKLLVVSCAQIFFCAWYRPLVGWKCCFFVGFGFFDRSFLRIPLDSVLWTIWRLISSTQHTYTQRQIYIASVITFRMPSIHKTLTHAHQQTKRTR